MSRPFATARRKRCIVPVWSALNIVSCSSRVRLSQLSNTITRSFPGPAHMYLARSLAKPMSSRCNFRSSSANRVLYSVELGSSSLRAPRRIMFSSGLKIFSSVSKSLTSSSGMAAFSSLVMALAIHVYATSADSGASFRLMRAQTVLRRNSSGRATTLT